MTGLKLKRVLDRWVHGTEDIPLAKLLTPFGVDYSDERKNAKPGLGMRTVRDGNDCKIASVYEGGAAHKAGLSAGDVLVAIDGLRVTATNLDGLLGRYRVGQAIGVHAFRRDELMIFNAALAASDVPAVNLKSADKPVTALRLRKAWLNLRG